MGIPGIASLFKWVVAIVLTISVIPIASRDSNAPDKGFEQTEEGKFDISGYEVTIIRYKVNKEMLNSSIIRTYGFIVERGGRIITELFIQKHFRPDWEYTNDASKEYTVWALEEKDNQNYIILKKYPQFQSYTLKFPGRELALTDVKDLVIERYVKDLLLR